MALIRNKQFKVQGDEVRMDESYDVVKGRNEKNKDFRKKLKNYYIVKYGLIGALLLAGWILITFVNSKTAVMVSLCVLGVIFIFWFLWCTIGGGIQVCCPHCNESIGRSNSWNIRKCPYCGTSLEILQYFEREKL